MDGLAQDRFIIFFFRGVDFQERMDACAYFVTERRQI